MDEATVDEERPLSESDPECMECAEPPMWAIKSASIPAVLSYACESHVSKVFHQWFSILHFPVFTEYLGAWTE